MNGNAARSISTRRRDMAMRYRRWCRCMVLAAATAIVLAGCGGSKSPSVANMATTTAPTRPTRTSSGVSSGGGAAPKGNGTVLLLECAACMRGHGDPNQTDPIVAVHGGINITIPPGDSEALSNEVRGGTAPCNEYLAAASNALRAADPAPPPPSDEASGVRSPRQRVRRMTGG